MVHLIVTYDVLEVSTVTGQDHHKSDAQFNVLYPLLEQRIRHACPKKEIRGGRYTARLIHEGAD